MTFLGLHEWEFCFTSGMMPWPVSQSLHLPFKTTGLDDDFRKPLRKSLFTISRTLKLSHTPQYNLASLLYKKLKRINHKVGKPQITAGCWGPYFVHCMTFIQKIGLESMFVTLYFNFYSERCCLYDKRQTEMAPCRIQIGSLNK